MSSATTTAASPRPLSYNPGANKGDGSKPRPLSLNPGSLQTPLFIVTDKNALEKPRQSNAMDVDAIYGQSDSMDAGNLDFSFDMSTTDDGLTPNSSAVVNNNAPSSAKSNKQKTIVMVGSKQKTIVAKQPPQPQQQPAPVAVNKQRTVVETKRAPAAAAPPPPPAPPQKRGLFSRLWPFGRSRGRGKKPMQQQQQGKRNSLEDVEEFDFDEVRREAEERHALPPENKLPPVMLQYQPSARKFGSRAATTTTAAMSPSSKPVGTGVEILSGTLLKKAKKTGQWNSRKFTLYDTLDLTWLKSDDKTVISFSLLPRDQVQVRDVKFGVRKFMIEVTKGEDNLLLSAAGETEKQEWLRALNACLHQVPEEGSSTAAPPSKRKSLAMVQKGKVSEVKNQHAEAIILGITNRGQLPTSLKSKQANERLQEKLNSTAPVTAATQGFFCTACEQQVFKPEEVRLKNYCILHRHCFTCSRCDRLLTLGSYEQDANTGAIFCERHFAEAFPGVPRSKTRRAKPARKDRARAMEYQFQLELMDPETGRRDQVLWFSTTSQFERDRWVLVLCNAIAAQELKRIVGEAQRVDMMTAVECQMELEAFLSRSDCAYNAFVDRLRGKPAASAAKWDRRWLELKPNGQLLISRSDKSRKPQRVIQLAHNSVLLDAHGYRLNGPLQVAEA